VIEELIQHLGRLEKTKNITFSGNFHEQQYSDAVLTFIAELLENNSFLSAMRMEHNDVKAPDALLALGIKLLIQYQAAREAAESFRPFMSLEAQENIYYAASAFLHAYDHKLKNRRFS